MAWGATGFCFRAQPSKAVTLAALLLSCSLSSAHANNSSAANEQLSLTLTTTSDNTSDLDIGISNGADFTFVNKSDWSNGSFTKALAGQSGGDSGLVQFSGGTVNKGVQMTVGFITRSTFNGFTIDSAEWSHPTGPNDPIPLKGLKLSVSRVGDPLNDLTITNGGDAYMSFIDLSFLADSPGLPLGAPVGSEPGFTIFDANLLLAPGQSQDFLFPALTPLDYLYIEGSAYESDSAGDQLYGPMDFRFGHQSPVPEGSTWALLATGFLAIAAFGIGRRSTPRESRLSLATRL